MKKLIAIMVVLALCLSVLPMASAAEGTTVYLTPNSNWTQSNARFAVYCFQDGLQEQWVDMTVAEEGIYKADIPAGYTNIIFCRMNPGTSDNGWGNKWNQTSDLVVPTDGTNHYTVADGTWDNGGGTWSTYSAGSGNQGGNQGGAQTPTYTYIIAGDAALCGNNWNPSDTNNGMTDNGDGTYSKTYTSVAAGDYAFKVTTGGGWDNAIGGDGANGNYVFTVTAACDVTITLNADKTITVSGDNVTAYNPTITTYYVAGSSALCGSNFDPGDANNAMTNNAGVWSKTYTAVAAGDYAFKITGGNWNNQWGGTGADGNYEFTVYVECDVTISFNADSHEITVTATNNGLTDPGAGGSGGAGGSTPAPTVSYFVAGSESLCGVAWDEKAEANKMTESSGVYTKTYNNVPVGDYEFKVTNGTWDDGCSWGKDGQNFKFSVTAACNVTVTFNPNTKEITVTGDNVELPAPPAPGYYVAGNGAAGNSWVNGAAWECDNASNKMTESNGVYTIKYTNVAPGEYEFKVTDGTWDHAWPGENYKFKVTTACDVTVTFNPTTGAVSVKGAGIPSADTADSTNLVALTAVLVLSAAGLAVLTKKKEF